MTSIEEIKTVSMKQIKEFQKAALKVEQLEIQTAHRFIDGIYSREVFMPKGAFVVSKLHKTENISIISKGACLELREGEPVRRIEAPLTMISNDGVKRLLYILEDTIWTTMHYNPTNEKDIMKLEDFIIEKEIEVDL